MRLTQITQLFAHDKFTISGSITGSNAWVHIEACGFVRETNGFVSTDAKIMVGGATQAELDAIVAALSAPFDRQRQDGRRAAEQAVAVADVVLETANVD